MTETSPILMWFRRDLRLGDHAALTHAIRSGRPVIPIFIRDDIVDEQGAAPRFRLGLSLDDLDARLRSKGSRLILRQGNALEVLRGLIAQTGAGAVYWSRLYDPDSKRRDTAVKSALKAEGIDAQSFAGHVLFEPWTVETKTGGYYKVYSPFWKAVRGTELRPCLPEPKTMAAPGAWPVSDALGEWSLGADMRRGAAVMVPHCVVGEVAAQKRLSSFIADKVADYKSKRDFPAASVTSGLSENLTYGEISPLACWHAGWAALNDGVGEAEHFLKEVVWREFAYHLTYHTPHIVDQNWREGWEDFGWSSNDSEAVLAWKQGRTGIPFVDAAMREMYVTGVMHNRARMIVASYLTKHMLVDWRVGRDWFADCLTDWDPASNAMGWQWVAGCGPDAAPYFRVFNPVSQAEKFDPEHDYLNRWIAEGRAHPHPDALSYFDATPISWNLRQDADYPPPIVGLKEGRDRALATYSAHNSK